MILVSACLLGLTTRYDGRQCPSQELLGRALEGQVLAVCPEVLGGLPVPRPAARIVGARAGREGQDVLDGLARLVGADGGDVTEAFVRGARLALERALAAGVTRCYLKDRSPSCGHDPQGSNPDGGPAYGVFAALARRHGLEIIEVRAKADDPQA